MYHAFLVKKHFSWYLCAQVDCLDAAMHQLKLIKLVFCLFKGKIIKVSRPDNSQFSLMFKQCKCAIFMRREKTCLTFFVDIGP